jgi:hypothetical protein
MKASGAVGVLYILLYSLCWVPLQSAGYRSAALFALHSFPKHVQQLCSNPSKCPEFLRKAPTSK